MKKIFAGLILAAGLLGASPAFATTCPVFVYGLVLSAAQWQACFDAKQNLLGYTPLNIAGGTMTGALGLPASSASAAALNLAAGATPSTPRDGDVWTTASGMFVRINGTTVGPLIAGFNSLTLNALVLGNGAGAPTALGSLGTTTTVLHGNAVGPPSWGAVNLATDITGTLPAARLPNPSATTLGGIQSIAAVAHRWINTISTSGVPSLTQPAFSDLSGVAANSQIPAPGTGLLGGINTTQCGGGNTWVIGYDNTGTAVCTQPDFSDLTGTITAAQLPTPTPTTLGGIRSFAAVSHQWINVISTSGVPSSAQPAFTDISGTVAHSQMPLPGAIDLGGILAADCAVHRFADGVDPASGALLCDQPAFSDLSGTLTAAQLPAPTLSTFGGILAINAVSHQFLTSITTSGVPVLAQPAFTDISGSVAASQLPNPSATTLGGVKSLASATHKFINTISTAGLPAATQPDFSDLTGTATAAQLPTPTLSTIGGVQAFAAPSHQWIDTISTAGVISSSQPDFSDLTGVADNSQIPAPGPGALGGINDARCALSNTWVIGYDNTGSATCTQPGFSDLSGNVDLTSQVTGVLPIVNGGTGASTAANARSALGLVIGTNVQAWDADLDALSALAATAGILKRTGAGTFGLAISGTDYAPPTSGATVLVGNGAGGFSNYTGGTCTNRFVRGVSAAGAPTCDFVVLTSDVSGILPGANGGTGNGFVAFAGPTTSLKTFTLPNSSATILTTGSLVTVAQGGTGVSSLPSNGVLYGQGTFSIASVPLNTTATNKYLQQASSSAPTFAQVAFADISGSVAAAQLPNPSASTLGGIQSAAAVSHQWINSISTSGIPSLTQPDISDITGLGTAAAYNVVTSGAGLPAINVTNQWSAPQIMTSGSCASPSVSLGAPGDSGLFNFGVSDDVAICAAAHLRAVFYGATGSAPVVFGNSSTTVVPTSIGGGNTGIENIGTLAQYGAYRALALKNTNGGAPFIVLGHSLSTANGSFSALGSGAFLGYVSFAGDDGASYNTIGANIVAIAKGTWTTGVGPADILIGATNNAGVTLKVACFDADSGWWNGSGGTSSICTGQNFLDRSSNLSVANGTVSGLLSVGGDVQMTGSAPALSACGTSPTIVSGSTDTSGEVLEGTGAIGCVVTFHTPKAFKPFCVVSSQSQVTSFAYSDTIAALTVVNTALTGETFDYHCLQHF